MQIDPKTVHEELVATLGPSTPSYTIVRRRFHEGREHVSNHPRSASSLSEFTGESIEQVISNDPHSTYDKIIAETSLSTIEQIIHN